MSDLFDTKRLDELVAEGLLDRRVFRDLYDVQKERIQKLEIELKNANRHLACSEVLKYVSNELRNAPSSKIDPGLRVRILTKIRQVETKAAPLKVIKK